MEENQDNEPNKRGRGRPAGAKNKLKNVTTLAKNREMAREEVKRLINLFVIKKMQKIDDLYDSLSNRDQAKLLDSLIKYSTPTSSKDVEILNKDKDVKKQITEIKISYEKPNQIEQNNTIDITPHEDVDENQDEDHPHADDIDEEDKYEF